MIAIIDYGSGNLSAIANIYKELNVPHEIVNEPGRLSGAKSYILPGVGHFDFTMKKIKDSGLFVELQEQVITCKKPLLGICVGMHLLANTSDEGQVPGLGWVPGHVAKIVSGVPAIRLPHMGWTRFPCLAMPEAYSKVSTLTRASTFCITTTSCLQLLPVRLQLPTTGRR